MREGTHPKAFRLALRYYIHYIHKYKRTAYPALILPGIGSICVFYIPPLVLSKMIERFDGVIFSLSDTLPYIALLGSAWLLGEFLWRVAFVLLIHTEYHACQDLYIQGLSQMFEKDPAFFQDNFAGSLTKKVIGYGRNFENFLDTLVFSVFANILPLLFVLFILAQKSPLLTITLLACLALTVVLIFPRIRDRQRLIQIREQASNTMAGHIADSMANIQTIHAFAKESEELKTHAHFVHDYMRKAKKTWDYSTYRIDGFVSPIYVAVNVIGLILAVATGKNSAQIATIFLTFSYFGQASRVLWEFNRTYRNLEGAVSDAAQFTNLLLEDPVILDPKRPIQLTNSSGVGEISFSNVSYTYNKNGQVGLFKNFNLHITAGEKVALVGPSGGGKTTITKLLLRFIDTVDGDITINDSSIRSMSKKDLRNLIAYVPQDPQMFHRTLRDNIRYGKQNASDEEVVRSAKQAHADEFINDLPKGYDTLVGERGTKLSGGQRQRVAIARAMLKDSPILILDEATSALDSESEHLIQDALWKLMHRRTAIVIAHRLSTIQKMDRIIVLDNGKIVEQGTHTELLKRNGLYARLWAHQSGGFIEE